MIRFRTSHLHAVGRSLIGRMLEVVHVSVKRRSVISCIAISVHLLLLLMIDVPPLLVHRMASTVTGRHLAIATGRCTLLSRRNPLPGKCRTAARRALGEVVGSRGFGIDLPMRLSGTFLYVSKIAIGRQSRQARALLERVSRGKRGTRRPGPIGRRSIVRSTPGIHARISLCTADKVRVVLLQALISSRWLQLIISGRLVLIHLFLSFLLPYKFFQLIWHDEVVVVVVFDIVFATVGRRKWSTVDVFTDILHLVADIFQPISRGLFGLNALETVTSGLRGGGIPTISHARHAAPPRIPQGKHRRRIVLKPRVGRGGASVDGPLSFHLIGEEIDRSRRSVSLPLHWQRLATSCWLIGCLRREGIE